MVQWRPDTGIIGNSVMSLPCGLAILFYAQQAVFAPHLENGISPMEMVGASVERYFEGARAIKCPTEMSARRIGRHHAKRLPIWLSRPGTTSAPSAA